MLAAKASLAIRVDALGEESNNELGIEHRAKLESRLRMLEEGNVSIISDYVDVHSLHTVTTVIVFRKLVVRRNLKFVYQVRHQTCYQYLEMIGLSGLVSLDTRVLGGVWEPSTHEHLMICTWV